MCYQLRSMTSLYIMHGSQILLLYREGSRVANHLWIGSSGGHMEESEINHPKMTVLRELKEEIGLDEDQLTNLHMRYITMENIKGEIYQNYYLFAQINEMNQELLSTEGKLQWFDQSDVFDLDMPRGSRYVLEHYLNHQDNKDLYVCGLSKDSAIFTKLEQREDGI